MFNEMHFGTCGMVEMKFIVKVVIRLNVRYFAATALHTLKQKKVARYVGVDEVEG